MREVKVLKMSHGQQTSQPDFLPLWLSVLSSIQCSFSWVTWKQTQTLKTFRLFFNRNWSRLWLMCVLLSAQFWERDLIASAQAAKEGSCCGAGGWDLVKGEIPLINFRSRQNCEYMNYQMQSVTSWGERGAQHQSQHPFPPLDVTQALFVEASAICSSSFRKIYKF